MVDEKDTFFKRMKRGFGVLLFKVRTIATKMNDGQKEVPKTETKQESKPIENIGLSGTDMSYAPEGLGL